MRARHREPWGQRPEYHETINRVLLYIRLGYSAERLADLFNVPVKSIQKMKDRFG